MSLKRAVWIDASLVASAFVIGAAVYHLLPAEMPVHWGMNGRPDSYAGRFVGVFGFPIAVSIAVFLMIFLPWLDPQDVRLPKHYNAVLVIVPAVLLAIYVWTLLASLGIRIPAIVPVSEAILFYSLGLMLQNLERNSRIGLKFPWVLSSNAVWKKTHRLIGMLFRLSAVVVLAGLIYPQYQSYLSTTFIVATPLSGIIYSVLIYLKERREIGP